MVFREAISQPLFAACAVIIYNFNNFFYCLRLHGKRTASFAAEGTGIYSIIVFRADVTRTNRIIFESNLHII